MLLDLSDALAHRLPVALPEGRDQRLGLFLIGERSLVDLDLAKERDGEDSDDEALKRYMLNNIRILPQMMQEAPMPILTRFSYRLRGLILRIMAMPGISTRTICTTTDMVRIRRKNLLLKKPLKGLISLTSSFLALISLKI